ncbi:SpaH/EbpB family LPXTG-anchored major pilin [Ruania alkalisoli]|uniref:SpaH/EbpB family LPXTG-anchored major pilin n=1 Tax=Ruania alkalisoli TaxID=2779775 RepID=A0A7M1SVV9_9MICO|nr:SpaH/EbpB family LPXTG-anchored major pilin [Ruania alkalisoli]QOR71665.1 SpaH/EbpB family LPXTG-anchored major pilin [Ruania alkalisoli]
MSRSHRPLRRLAAAVSTAALGVLGIVALSAPAGAAPGPNLDPEATGSLTIHKYESPNEDPGLPNDGSEIPDPGLNPLEGVEFTLTQVTDIDLTTNEGWNEADALATSVAAGGDLGGHTTSVVGSQTTAADGTAFFGDLPMGVYYVEETAPGPNQIVAPVEPFIVTVPLPTTVDEESIWLYDVHVYPKNALGENEKSLDDSDAYGLGDTVSFAVDSAIPSFFGTEELASYSIVDELDTRLAYTAGTTVVSAVDSGAADIGLAPADYTITEPAGPTGGTLTVEFTASGLAKLAAAPGGTVTVEFDTTVTAIGDGTITNDAITFINDHEINSNTVETLWGAVEIFKFDEETLDGLEGAVFEVYLDETGGDPIAVDGATEFTTDENGRVVIPGLKVGTYWIEETVAPERYLGVTDRIQVTVVVGSIEEAVLVEVPNEKIPDVELPLTGSQGVALFTTLGIGLILVGGGTAILLARRGARR